jgi:hypothetical protein
MPETLEAEVKEQIHTALMAYDKLGKLWALRVNSGRVKVGKHWIYLGRDGAPDYILCMDGQFIALELKRPEVNKKLRETQVKTKFNLEMVGAKWHTVDNVDELHELVRSLRWRRNRETT